MEYSFMASKTAYLYLEDFKIKSFLRGSFYDISCYVLIFWKISFLAASTNIDVELTNGKVNLWIAKSYC